MNKIILTGRLTRDPEVRFTQGSEPMAVCKFTVAVERPYKRDKKEGEASADFINCVCFGKSGEIIEKHFKKGSRINLSGRLQIDSYTDKEGNKRTAANVVIADFEFVDKKEESKNDTQDDFDGFPW